MPTHVYLAGDFARRAELAEVADNLATFPGVNIISSWLSTPPLFPDGVGGQPNIAEYRDEAREVAIADKDDIGACDLFVQFTTGEHARGGRHWELGYAMGLGSIKCVVIGPQEHVFHFLPDVVVLPDVTALLYWLAGYLEK